MSDTYDVNQCAALRHCLQLGKDFEAAKLRESCWAKTLELAAKQVEHAGQERDAALSALGMLYDKWENGDPCYEDPEEQSGSLGNAFKLNLEEENLILALLKDPSAALAERDRNVRDAERKGLIGLLTIADKNCEMYPAIQYLEREFGLEQKTKGVAAFFGTWPGDETDQDLGAAVKDVRE